MKNMTLENIAKAVNGRLCNYNDEDKDKEANGVVLDSRQVEEGYVFIATRGERVDGHSFIDAVFDKEALGVICEKEPANPKGPYILVEDSFAALKAVARFYRSQLSCKVVGITGSVGKTSTKEFIASTLSVKYDVLKTEGNFNNEVGLPLTVLKIRDNTEIAVLEMGISDFGEMHRLSEIARPDVCVMTNIGQCHLENLGTRDGILKAKSEIFDFINEDGAIFLNGDDDKLSTISEVHGIKPVLFGEDKKNDVYATDYENLGLDGSRVNIHYGDSTVAVDIPLPGKHMVYNALCACAVALRFGLSDREIAKGISMVEAVGGRSHIIKTDSLTIIDDCYNANPVSMKAAIDLLSLANTRKVAILGDMFELGANEHALHEEVGAYALSKDIDMVVCIGNLSMYMYHKAPNCLYYESKAEFMGLATRIIQRGDTVLVKASHGMHFEEIVNFIKNIELR